MKKFRKLTAMVSALVLAGCMVGSFNAITADAATNSIVITTTDKATHTYNAYQVFKGTYDSSGILTNIQWGDNFDQTQLASLVTELKAIEIAVPAPAEAEATTVKPFDSLSENATAQNVADALSGAEKDSDLAKKFANAISKCLTGSPATATNSGTVTISDVADGYYLVQDGDLTASNDGEKGAKTRFMLEVVGGTVNATAKSTAPTVVKKVKEDSSSTEGGYGAGYNDVADYSIGEDVPFLLQATLTNVDEIAQYDSYDLVFHDKLDATVFTAPTSGNSSLTVDIDGTKLDLTAYSEYIDIKYGTDVTDGDTIDVTITDLQGLATKAGVTLKNDSKINVKYNAQLSSSANIGNKGQENAVYLEYSSNPNITSSGTYSTETEKTPTDEVVVYTYALELNKVDGSNNNTPLPGAKFTLVDDNGKYVNIVNGKVSLSNDKVELETPESGTLTFLGLDAGEYTLTEVSAPAGGYNKLTSTVKLTIEANNDAGEEQSYAGDPATQLPNYADKIGETEGYVKLTAENSELFADSDGVKSSYGSAISESDATVAVKVDIQNNKGATLPSTGGIGTTIFYLSGGVLVVGAGVTLIAKKRMKANK